MTTHVFYYLAGTLGESERHPNVFSLPKNENGCKLSDITSAFPLSGSFHFRFKTKIKDYGHVWMDLNNPSSTVPKFGTMIFAKVLQLDKVRFAGVARGRLESGTTYNPVAPSTKTNQTRTPGPSSNTNTNTNTNPRKHHRKPSTKQKESSRNSKQSTKQRQSPPPQSQNTPEEDDDDMFSFNTSTNKSSSSKPMAGAIYSSVESAPDIAPNEVKKALGRLGTNTSKVETKMADTSEMSAAVKKKYLQRKADMQANIDAKLAHHLLEAEQVEKDQIERDSVKTRLKPKLLLWSGDPKLGTLKNVRALLSTMDSILWKGKVN